MFLLLTQHNTICYRCVAIFTQVRDVLSLFVDNNLSLALKLVGINYRYREKSME